MWSHSVDKFNEFEVLQSLSCLKKIEFRIFRTSFFFRNHAFPNSRSESPSVFQSTGPICWWNFDLMSSPCLGSRDTSTELCFRSNVSEDMTRSNPEYSWIHASPRRIRNTDTMDFYCVAPCSSQNFVLLFWNTHIVVLVLGWIWGDLKTISPQGPGARAKWRSLS